MAREESPNAWRQRTSPRVLPGVLVALDRDVVILSSSLEFIATLVR